ncbi:hypothetical protein [Fuerstiella marisgermanici]|nr:hypothetical protein [Fuerstiella marisgermanici]
MKFLPVLKWMIFLILVAALAASGGFVYFQNHKDQLVESEILKRFAEVAPELKLIVGRTTLNGTRGATLKQVEIREKATDRPLFRAKELTVDIDSTRLLEHQQVIVDKIHLTSADVLLTREVDGRWNWQKYEFRPPKLKSPALPAIIMDDVAVQLTLKHGGNVPAARLLLRESRLQAIPKSQHAYDFDGALNLPGAGMLRLGGGWDLQSRQWHLGGKMLNVQADQQLMQLAKATAPQLNDQLTDLDSAIERALPPRQTANAASPGAALLIGNNGQTAPQFLGMLDVFFNVAGAPENSIPQFQLMVNVKNGRLETPAIPIALTNVKATFFRDNESLTFKLDEATGDNATITGGFEMETRADAPPGQAWFDIKRFPVDARLRPLLPPRAQRLFDGFQPKGVVSVKGQIRRHPSGRWMPVNVVADFEEGTSEYHRFRYPVKNVFAHVVQRPYANRPATPTESGTTVDDMILDVEVSGIAGDLPFTSTGWWKNPGPKTETRFELAVQNFPLDSRFRNALNDKELSVVENLNLTGMANVSFVFHRPPGLDQPTHVYADAQVFNSRMRFSKFPYDIEDLTAHLTFNSATKHWKFLELNGRHGEGRIRAAGSFRGQPEPGVLDLQITATKAALDSDLYNVLSKPQQTVWNLINPSGFCDLTAKIDWTAGPGHSPIVTFPRDSPVRVYNTKIRPTPFPFDMTIREAVLSFDPNDVRAAGNQHCEIRSFQATHEGAEITAKNCWADIKPNGEWQVHFNNLSADNLRPDDQLRAALPASWRETMGRVQHVGVVSLTDSQMDFRGDTSGERNTTAKWALNVNLRDCMVNAGLDVKHVHGAVTANGTWDGFHLKNTGEINVETAEVLDMPFTNIHGPYSLNDVELVLGSRQVFERQKLLADIDRSTRMKALAYGGELLLDAHVDLREGGRYQFFTELANARLESYAARHIPDQTNLKGVVTAWMSLEGTGEEARDVTGKGQLLIHPAALYEIPVVVKLLGSLSQLRMNVQDRTAFNYAILDFEVADEAFWFERVDLVGESISLRGKGTVGFAGAVNLDFYSRPARSRAAAIPFISGLFTNWAKIEVRGTTSRPQTRVEPTARLNEGLKLFLQPFNPNPGGPVPGLNTPRNYQRTIPNLQQRAAGQPRQAVGVVTE